MVARGKLVDCPQETRQRLIRWWGWLLLATSAIALLIARRYLVVVQPTDALEALVFRWVMLVAHLGTLALVVLAPAALLARFWPRPAPVMSLTILLAMTLLTALLVDTQVYQLYRMHIDMGVINLLTGGAATATFIFPGVMYWQSIAMVAGLSTGMGFLGWLAWNGVRRSHPRRALARVFIGIYIACLLGFHGVHIWADARSYEAVTVETDILPLRYAATAKRFLRAMGIDLQPGTLATSDDQRSAMAYPLAPVNCARPRQEPNILLIVIDSWRFDAFNGEATPSIARFASGASVFTRHHSGGNATRIGVFSLFYSIPGTYWHRVLNEGIGPVVIRELLDQDYDVEVFRSAPLYSPEFDRTVFVDVPNPRLRSDGDGPADWDRDLTDDFKAFLGNRQPRQPFFSFLFYDSPHSFQFPDDYPLPFEPSLDEVNYFLLDESTDPQPFINRYLNSVHYVDRLIGEALQAVEAAGIMDETLILITSDHGQEFNDSGRNYWGHNGNFSRYQTEVPFIWYEPGRAPAVYDHRTSHFDVMPTLLREALGCNVVMEHVSVGQPLFEPTPREVMVMSDYDEFAIVQPGSVATVRRSGISIFDPAYRRMHDSSLAPGVIAAALEHKRRFYKSERIESE